MPEANPSRPPRRLADCLIVFALSTGAVVVGVAVGRAVHAPGPGVPRQAVGSFLDGFIRWDGNYYREIATRGYLLRAGQAAIHFPPGYPLLARAVQIVTGASIEGAMVLASHACFLAALLILANLTERRHTLDHPHARRGMLLALGFVPVGVFFHLGYTESLFLLIVATLMHLIDRGAHPVVVAAVAALGLVTRLVGLALCLPVVLYAWQFRRGVWESVGWSILCLLISLTGLVALMAYFDHRFDDPILFLRGRADLWRANPPLPIGEKAARLLILEPVWGLFTTESPGYWRHHMATALGLITRFNMENRIGFLAALGLTWWGGRRKLLNRSDLSLILGLIALPYWVNGYDSNMDSMARYMATIAPLYPVAGVLAGQIGLVPSLLLAGSGAILMAVHTALFAQGYWLE